MKAIFQDRYGSADVLSIRDVDKPVAKDDEVLLRVHAAGLDPGVWHLMTGLPYLVRYVGFGVRRPKNPIPGSDVAGRVEAVGKDVTGFRPGDEVFGTGIGTFAEFACAKAAKIAAKPENLSFEEAAAVPTSSLTALQGVRDQAKVQAGQSVLIIGAAGGVGHFAVQIAKDLGAEVTGVCSTSKTELVRSLGANHAIDYTKDDFTDGTRRYDAILDTAGNRPLSQLRRALAPRGTLVIVGGEGGGRWIGMGRQLRASLLSLFVRQKLRWFVASERQEDLLHLKTLVEAGKLAPVVDKTYPLHEAPDAIRNWEQGHARGKVVITVAN